MTEKAARGFLLERFPRMTGPLHGTLSPQVALIGIAVIGLGARLLRIDAESIWLDESFSIWAAKHSFGGMMKIAEWDPHPPLYYLLLKTWMAVFGTSETAVRSLSAVAGAIAVWGMGQLFFALRRWETGLFAASLLALTPMHIWYSQETRSYALFFMAVILATATLLRAMHDPSWRNYAFHVVAATFTFYTHAYSVFMFAAFLVIYVGAFLVAREDTRLTIRNFVLLHAAIGIACLPWALFILKQTKSAVATLWIREPTFDTVIDSYELLAGSMLLLTTVLLLGAFALIDLRRKHLGTQRVLLITAITLAVAFPVGAALVSHLWRPIFLPRAVIPALGGFIILAAAGLTQLPQRLRIAGLAVLLVAFIVPLQGQLVGVSKDDWRASVGRVNDEAEPGDIVILDVGFTRHVYDYYSNRTDLKVLESPTFQAEIGPWLEKQNATLEGPGNVWHFRIYSDDQQQLISKELAKERTKTFSAQYWGMWLYHWHVNETEPAPEP